MSANGGFAKGMHEILQRLAELNSVECEETYSRVLSWIKRKTMFLLINLIGLCLQVRSSVFDNGLINESVSADIKTIEVFSKKNT